MKPAQLFIFATWIAIGPLSYGQAFVSAQNIQPDRTLAGQQWMLLQSGRVLKGKVTQGRSDYRIAFSDQDYVIFPKERVDRVFDKRNDMLNYRIAITPLVVSDQSRLLRWLLDNRAIDKADNLLRDIQLRDIQIDVDYWQKQIQASRVKTETGAGVTAAPSKSNPSVKGFVQTAFEERVQGHLVAGCGLSGCHDSRSTSSFALKARFGHRLSGKETEENLRRVLKYVRTSPPELIRYISQPHGKLQRGIFPRASKAYLDIASWANRVTREAPHLNGNASQNGADSRLSGSLAAASNTAASNTAAKANTGSNGTWQPKSVPRIGIRDPSVQAASGSSTYLSGNRNSKSGSQTNARLQTENRSNRGSAAGGSHSTFGIGVPSSESVRAFVPRDEFDPQIFNRQQPKPDDAPRVSSRPAQPELPGPPAKLISPAKTKSKN